MKVSWRGSEFGWLVSGNLQLEVEIKIKGGNFSFRVFLEELMTLERPSSLCAQRDSAG